MKPILFLALLAGVNFVRAQTHDHHSETQKTTIKKIDVKTQFVPTPDLKVRMEKILNLMAELSAKKDDLKAVKSYGVKLTEVVNDIFKTCKLEPDADAAIHPSLGLILQGAQELKKGQYESGHKKIHEALLNYEKIFKHEGWKP